MESLAEFKRGDTFIQQVTLLDGTGLPWTLTADQIKSQIRNSKDALISELTIEVVSATVTTATETTSATSTDISYIFSEDNTQHWTVGDLYWAIQITIDGEVSSSPTVIVPVVADITHV